jgi:hypothetical protein
MTVNLEHFGEKGSVMTVRSVFIRIKPLNLHALNAQQGTLLPTRNQKLQIALLVKPITFGASKEKRPFVLNAKGCLLRKREDKPHVSIVNRENILT